MQTQVRAWIESDEQGEGISILCCSQRCTAASCPHYKKCKTYSIEIDTKEVPETTNENSNKANEYQK